MKAIVAEIDKKHMIVITDKGDFVKVKRQMSVGIGDEIELKPQKKFLTYKRLASMAACFLAFIFLSTGVYAYYTPYSYVSVDINPSVALSLNRFERVLSVEPLTEDAVSIINDAESLKNRNIDEALATIIKSASEKGYIKEEAEDQVTVIVSAKDPKEGEKLASTVNKTAVQALSKVNKNSEVIVEKTDVEEHKAALSNKVSPGKEVLAKKLKEMNPEIKDEEIKNMTVKEVANLINEYRKAAKEAEKDDRNKKERTMDRKDDEKSKNNDKFRPAASEIKDDKGNNKNKDKGNEEADRNEKRVMEKNKDNRDKGDDKDGDKDDDKDNKGSQGLKDKNNNKNENNKKDNDKEDNENKENDKKDNNRKDSNKKDSDKNDKDENDRSWNDRDKKDGDKEDEDRKDGNWNNRNKNDWNNSIWDWFNRNFGKEEGQNRRNDD